MTPPTGIPDISELEHYEKTFLSLVRCESSNLADQLPKDSLIMLNGNRIQFNTPRPGSIVPGATHTGEINYQYDSSLAISPVNSFGVSKVSLAVKALELLETAYQQTENIAIYLRDIRDNYVQSVGSDANSESYQVVEHNLETVWALVNDQVECFKQFIRLTKICDHELTLPSHNDIQVPHAVAGAASGDPNDVIITDSGSSQMHEPSSQEPDWSVLQFAESEESEEDNVNQVYKCYWRNCSGTFPSLKLLRKHAVEHHLRVDSNGEYTCQWRNCSRENYAFACRNTLRGHITAIHADQKKHKCAFQGCKKTYKRRSLLVNHMKSHQQRETQTSSADSDPMHN